MTFRRRPLFVLSALALTLSACDYRREATDFTFDAERSRADIAGVSISEWGTALRLCPNVEAPRAPPPSKTSANPSATLDASFAKRSNVSPVPPGCAAMAGLSQGQGMRVRIFEEFGRRPFKLLKERPDVPRPAAKPLVSYRYSDNDELYRIDSLEGDVSTTDAGWPFAYCASGVSDKGASCTAAILIGRAYIELQWYDPAGVPDQARLWDLASAADVKLRTMLSPPVKSTQHP